MARLPAKKPAAKRKPKAPAAPVNRKLIRPPIKRTPEERKARAIELCLEAIASGWTLTRFSRHSHISRGALTRWMAEDTVQPRFFRAMQIKGLLLPDEASEIVRRIIDGKSVTRIDPATGLPVTTIEFLDPKAGRAALSHIEFRMMRELKAGYQPHRTVTNISDAKQLTDEALDAKFDALVDRLTKPHSANSDLAPSAESPSDDDKHQ